MATAPPRRAMGVSSWGSSPTTATCAGRRPSRRHAARSACEDGLPTTVARVPVALVIAPQIRRDVPRTLPSALAKNSDWEELYRVAPCQIAWQAASMFSRVHSPYQPATTAAARRLL